MSITKIATLLHTFITIILSYSVAIVQVLFITTAFSLYSRKHFFCTILKLSIYWLLECVSLKNAKLKLVKMQHFRKMAKLRCPEICEPH